MMLVLSIFVIIYMLVLMLFMLAEGYIMGLTPREALTKAGVLSGSFWLKDLCKNFC